MSENYKDLAKRLTGIEKLLQHLLAVELYKVGVPQREIGKHLGIATGSVNRLLKGVKKQK